MLVTNFSLNAPQAKALVVNALITFLIWARATGKTTGVLGPKSCDLVHKMPRSKGGFIGKDYEQILDRTMPEIVSVWDSLGYKENQHWRFGRPLEDWEKPLIPPIKWDHAVSWYNGSVIMLLSLAVKGISNGLSLQWLMGDEAKFYDRARLKEVIKALRGLRGTFGHVPEYLCQWYATDKWVDDIGDLQWILDKKKEMDPDLIETIYALQLEANELRAQLDELQEDDPQAAQLAGNLHHYNEICNNLRRNAVFYSEASAMDNLEILGPEFINTQRRELPPDEFKVAIANEDPRQGRSAFYGAINPDVHYYQQTHDLLLDQPLIIAADYQASISPILVAQYGRLPGGLFETMNFLRNVYALEPEGLAEAVQKFCEKFLGHRTKEVYYVYDHTAIGRSALGNSYRDVVVKILKENRWIVHEVYTGEAPRHGIKYEQIKNHLTNTDPVVAPPIRINTLLNEELKISMERTRAINTGGKVTQKDKTHENTHRYPDYPQQYATHFPDTFDQIIWATHELKLVPLFRGSTGFWGGLR